jgi:hypothetical protein
MKAEPDLRSINRLVLAEVAAGEGEARFAETKASSWMEPKYRRPQHPRSRKSYSVGIEVAQSYSRNRIESAERFCFSSR